MNTEQVQLERRGAQRFDFHLPVTVRLAGSGQESCGFTQDLSARGAFVYLDMPVLEGSGVEMTLVMPSEITLAENMRVRCRGAVVRVHSPSVGTKYGVAVRLQGYEFLSDAAAAMEPSADFNRISALHEHIRQEGSGPANGPAPGTRNLVLP